MGFVWPRLFRTLRWEYGSTIRALLVSAIRQDGWRTSNVTGFTDVDALTHPENLLGSATSATILSVGDCYKDKWADRSTGISLAELWKTHLLFLGKQSYSDCWKGGSPRNQIGYIYIYNYIYTYKYRKSRKMVARVEWLASGFWQSWIVILWCRACFFVEIGDPKDQDHQRMNLLNKMAPTLKVTSQVKAPLMMKINHHSSTLKVTWFTPW